MSCEDIKIVNVVATFTLMQKNEQAKLDLKLLSLKLRHAEFNPKRFAAMTIRTRSKKCSSTTCLVFASGRAVVTGAANEEASMSACKAYVDILNHTGIDPPLTQNNWKIQNIVATGQFNYTINLYAIQKQHSHVANYDPSLFPGLIWKDAAWDGKKLLIFRSGKCVLTGAKNYENIEEMWKFTQKMVAPHQDTGTSSSSAYHAETKRKRKRSILAGGKAEARDASPEEEEVSLAQICSEIEEIGELTP